MEQAGNRAVGRPVGRSARRLVGRSDGPSGSRTVGLTGGSVRRATGRSAAFWSKLPCHENQSHANTLVQELPELLADPNIRSGRHDSRACSVLEGHCLLPTAPYAVPMPCHEWVPAATRGARCDACAFRVSSLRETCCKTVRSWVGHAPPDIRGYPLASPPLVANMPRMVGDWRHVKTD